jgi:hypothetical protein
MRKIVCAFAMCVGCFSLHAYCQSDNSVINNAVAGLKSLSGNHIIEKAYLHFDKPYYAAGDAMYFKAYVTLGEHFDLSKLSSVLHVELVGPENAIIKSIKMQLVNGVAWGDFTLPYGLHEGNYRVRAYTNYMQNAPEYFFDKAIPIGSVINTGVGTNQTPSVQSSKADMQFFPEGGELVNAMVSKVAFKAIGTNGLGLEVTEGTLVDNTNGPVASFKSSHLGMGIFYLMPQEGKTYKAKVTFADGSKGLFDLPAAMSKGIALAVKDTLGKMSVEVHTNRAYFQDNQNKNINIVIYGGGVVSTVKAKLDSRRLSMAIPNSQFPSGVVRVTLFSQSGDPLSERLLFLKNPDMINLTLTGNKSVYGKRDRVSLTLNAKDKGVDAQGHFSVAVIDESKVPFDENKETTILTYRLLSSELKGYIEKPNYYFLQNTDQTAADLDALMLTQGYRRFTWKQLLNDRDAAFTYVAEKALEITGTAKTTSGSPVSGMDVMLTSTSSNSMLGDKTDKDGKFKFNIPSFPDSALLTLQATGSIKTRKATVFTIDRDTAVVELANKQLPGLQNNVNPSMITYLKVNQALHSDLYSNVAVQMTGKKADEVVSGDEIRGATSLIAALSGRLQNVNFVQGVPYLKGQSSKNPMLVVVDGKIAGSYVNLDNISPGDLEKVEVLKGSNADSYGIYGNSGVLAVTYRAGVSKNVAQNAAYKYNAKSVVKLKDVSTGESKNNYVSSNLGGSGHADQVIKAAEISNLPSLSTALNGRLRGVIFVRGVPYLSTSMIVQKGVQSIEPMYIVVDGSPYNSSEGLDDINPKEVETVELLKGPSASIYGMNGGAGVLVITLRSKTTDMEVDKGTLGTLVFHARGFYAAREFYSPKYENKIASRDKTDLRSTIFWAPELLTNKDGNAYFEYYNADGQGSFRVVVEGVDNNGNIGRQVYRYKVE